MPPREFDVMNQNNPLIFVFHSVLMLNRSVSLFL